MKSPFLIASLHFCLTYGFLWWTRVQTVSDRKVPHSRGHGSRGPPCAEKKSSQSTAAAEHVPDLGVCAWVEHLAALLTPQTGGVPVMAHGLAPLSKVDWLSALATRPHPA